MVTHASGWPDAGRVDGAARSVIAVASVCAPASLGPGPQWSTSSFGHSTDTTPMELTALGHHLQQCQGGHRRWRTLQRGAQAVHCVVAPRFVSTLAVVLLGVGVLLLLL